MTIVSTAAFTAQTLAARLRCHPSPTSHSSGIEEDRIADDVSRLELTEVGSLDDRSIDGRRSCLRRRYVNREGARGGNEANEAPCDEEAGGDNRPRGEREPPKSPWGSAYRSRHVTSVTQVRSRDEERRAGSTSRHAAATPARRLLATRRPVRDRQQAWPRGGARHPAQGAVRRMPRGHPLHPR